MARFKRYNKVYRKKQAVILHENEKNDYLYSYQERKEIAMKNLVIETKQLTKVYGEQTAVHSINLHVEKGRIYGLLGRNGAGKTTIMKMILGLTSVTSGEVKFLGEASEDRKRRYIPASERLLKPLASIRI